jgi:drug/metabolite transporter (DMT)-like permease
MIVLLLSILSSTVIFLIFKLFDRFKIDTFQAIVFNYATALVCGFALYGHTWNPKAITELSWLMWAIVCGILFISLFVIMGKSAQLNGMGKTSISVKMSMAASVLGMIFFYNEPFSSLKMIAIVCAFVGVALVACPEREAREEKKSASWMLPVLFLGSGFLDLLLKYVESSQSAYISSALFAAIGFGFAGVFGLMFFGIQVFRGKMVFQWKNLWAGIVLGIPNYFSIYLLLEAYHAVSWQSSTVLAVTNISIVVMSGILGLLFFKERLNLVKTIGVVLCLLAIVGMVNG